MNQPLPQMEVCEISIQEALCELGLTTLAELLEEKEREKAAASENIGLSVL